jgi:hypothetical protein
MDRKKGCGEINIRIYGFMGRYRDRFRDGYRLVVYIDVYDWR